MSTYLRAAQTNGRTGRTNVTGAVLHLAVRGALVPVCGGVGAGAVERYQLTGPGFPGWERHAHWQPCLRCVRELDRLRDALIAQFLRTEAGAP